MKRRLKQKKSPHVKDYSLTQVGLDEADTREVDALVVKETELRKDKTIGRATLLREYSMPAIRARNQELHLQALRADEDRRSGDERRRPHPELVPTP